MKYLIARGNYGVWCLYQMRWFGDRKLLFVDSNRERVLNHFFALFPECGEFLIIPEVRMR